MICVCNDSRIIKGVNKQNIHCVQLLIIRIGKIINILNLWLTNTLVKILDYDP